MRSNMNMNRSQLLDWINQVSFAVTEMSLYLDTHSDDEDAMAIFEHYKEERKKALALYSANYSPLTLDTVTENNHWYWATDPWPWEGGYC
ncbi:spore coat protein CotJB [Roseburia sp. BX1005]|uniref:Spore coat protein CotJB n=2 Tax=Roseburia zhanii TaxID=2763064 RepID=A0A923LM75_9FIRM|nr:spore coat protein CotJB [Roseburia zhanii]